MSEHKIKFKETGVEHEELYTKLCNVLKEYSESMPLEEILAIASNLVGKLVAMQNQSKYTADQAMEIVITNIQKGNQQMIDELLSAPVAGNV